MSATKNYILLGPPGSGKSTQAEWLKKEFGLEHIDIGSELRAAAEADTEFGHALNEIINLKRELASDEVMQSVFQNVLDRVPQSTGVLLDGAPRRDTQVDEVEEVFRRAGREISRVIFINLSETESVARIARRFRCFGCHRPYILGSDLLDPSAPCSVCGGRIGQRKDDTVAGVQKRYAIFSQETLPVVEYFRNRGKLLEVDGSHDQASISNILREKLIENSDTN